MRRKNIGFWDGNFIIFDYLDRTEDKTPSLFVCFKEKNGWSRAFPLGEIINQGGAVAPSLSPDGNYLFFTKDSDIYWVSIAVIE